MKTDFKVRQAGRNVFEVTSNSSRCVKFMREWLGDDDRPTPTGDGRFFLILGTGSIKGFLTDAGVTGLKF